MARVVDKPAHAVVTRLEVSLDDRRVGVLADTGQGPVAFEYDARWLASGFSISPLSLPLRPGVFVPDVDPFNGLFGVFHDSLPDGWGALLLDRMLRERGADPAAVTPLTRLAIVGHGARGALTYTPQVVLGSADAVDDLDSYARMCTAIIEERSYDDLDTVYAAAGSSGGDRPKVFYHDGQSEWLVKFPSSLDPQNISVQEYEYSRAALDCGVRMPPTRLMPSSVCAGYFATQRFDREGERRIHTLSASGMLEVSHRLPLLDYEHLFQVTSRICNDERQLWDLFRLMCFNVFAHNQDDHSNNFSWLCRDGVWELSPAYDLTYATAFGDEHTTTVLGNGRPGMADVMALADKVGLKHARARGVADAIEKRCEALLASLELY